MGYGGIGAGVGRGPVVGTENCPGPEGQLGEGLVGLDRRDCGRGRPEEAPEAGGRGGPGGAGGGAGRRVDRRPRHGSRDYRTTTQPLIRWHHNFSINALLLKHMK